MEDQILIVPLVVLAPNDGFEYEFNDEVDECWENNREPCWTSNGQCKNQKAHKSQIRAVDPLVGVDAGIENA